METDQPTDEIALMPTDSTPTVDGEVSIVIPLNEEKKLEDKIGEKKETTINSSKKNRHLIYKYKKTPFSFFQVIILGCCLLLLILSCVAVETLRSGQINDEEIEFNIHSIEDKEHHEHLVDLINNDSSSTWTAKYNRFASRAESVPDFPNNAIEALRNILKEIKNSRDSSLIMGDTEEHIRELAKMNVALPHTFDSRLKWSKCWSVHQIQNQGGCGSCWAVSASAVMSDRICISSNYTLQPLISAQDLTSCCTACGGCQGTHWALAAFTYWKTHGVVSGGSIGSNEGCRPYQIKSNCGSPCSADYYEKSRTPSCELKCQPLYEKTYEEDLMKSRSAYWIRANDESEKSPEILKVIKKTTKELNISDVDLLKRELYINGPVLACFTLQESFQHYSRGIYSESIHSDILYGHCAKLIGWGEDDKERKYWLYANTWGRDWGEYGFFRVNFSDLPEEVVAGVV